MTNKNYKIKEIEKYLVKLDSKCDREASWVLDLPWSFNNRCTYVDRANAYRDGMYSILLSIDEQLADRFYEASKTVIDLYLEKIEARDPMNIMIGA